MTFYPFRYYTTRPKNLQDAVAKMSNVIRSGKTANALPSRCFKKVEVTIDNEDEDDPYPKEEEGRRL